MNCRQFPHHPEILAAMLIHLWELFANAFTAWTCFKKLQDRQNTTTPAIKQIDGMLYVIYHMTCFLGLIHGGKPPCKIKTPVPWSSDPWSTWPRQQRLHTPRETKQSSTPRHQGWVLQPFFVPHVSFSIRHTATHTQKNKHIFLYVNNPSHPWGGGITQHCSAALGQWLEPRYLLRHFRNVLFEVLARKGNDEIDETCHMKHIKERNWWEACQNHITNIRESYEETTEKDKFKILPFKIWTKHKKSISAEIEDQ